MGTTTTLLAWHRVYGTRGVHYAECALGRFRTHTAGGRTMLTLNDVMIGNHRDLAKARAHADLLIEATAEHFARRATGKPQSSPPSATAEAPP